MNMAFKVSPVDLSNDWDEYFATCWDSWSHPLQGVGELTFAHIGTGTVAEEESFKVVKQYYLNAAMSNQEQSHRLKCVETQSGAIVGGFTYEVYTSNPYKAGKPKFTAHGFESGSDLAKMSEEMYSQMLNWRTRLMSHAHICMFVVPVFTPVHLSVHMCAFTC